MAGKDKPDNDLRSTIDVRLSLMKDTDINNLKKIFDDFEKNIKALQMMGTVGERMGAAAAMGAGTSYSQQSNQQQSTAPGSKNAPQTPEQEKEQIDQNQSRLDAAHQRVLQSHVSQEFYKSLYGYPNHPANALQALLARGEIKNWRPQDFAALGAYGLGKAYYGEPTPNYNSRGEITSYTPTARTGMGAKLAGAGMAVLGLEGTGLGLSQIPGMVRSFGPTSFGSNVGLSNQGYLGTPIMSPAFQNYLGSQWQALNQSWFGLNPNYSTAQAKEAQGLINQYGYGFSGSMQGQMANALSTITGNIPSLPQSATMQMLDYGFRYGASSIQQMTAMISQIPQAAQAAQMSVGAFAQQLASTAVSIAQQQGIPESTAQAQVQSLSGATGMSPAITGGMLNNQFYTNVLAARMGGNFFAAQNSAFRGSMTQGLAQQMILQVAGVRSWGELQSMQKRGGAAWFGPNGVMNRLQVMYNSPGGKQLFGGLNPVLINHLLGRGINPETMGHAADAIRYARSYFTAPGAAPTTGPFSIHSIMNDLGMSSTNQANFLKGASMSHATYQDQLSKLSSTLQAEQHRATMNSHSRTVMVALQPDAQKLLRLVPQDNPATRPYYNQSDSSAWNTGTGGNPNIPLGK